MDDLIEPHTLGTRHIMMSTRAVMPNGSSLPVDNLGVSGFLKIMHVGLLQTNSPSHRQFSYGIICRGRHHTYGLIFGNLGGRYADPRRKSAKLTHIAAILAYGQTN